MWYPGAGTLAPESDFMNRPDSIVPAGHTPEHWFQGIDGSSVPWRGCSGTRSIYIPFIYGPDPDGRVRAKKKRFRVQKRCALFFFFYRSLYEGRERRSKQKEGILKGGQV